MLRSAGTSRGGRVKGTSTNLICDGKGRLRVAAAARRCLSSREDVDADQSPSQRTPAAWAPSPHQQGPPPGSRSPPHEAEQRKPRFHRHRRSPELARRPPQMPATRKGRRKGGGTRVTLVATRVADKIHQLQHSSSTAPAALHPTCSATPVTSTADGRSGNTERSSGRCGCCGVLGTPSPCSISPSPAMVAVACRAAWSLGSGT